MHLLTGSKLQGSEKPRIVMQLLAGEGTLDSSAWVDGVVLSDTDVVWLPHQLFAKHPLA